MKLSSIIALLLMMVVCLPSCTNDEDFILDTKDENGVEYFTCKNTWLESKAKAEAEGSKLVGVTITYDHFNLFESLPQNAYWQNFGELVIEADKDGSLIQLGTDPKASCIVSNVVVLSEFHTHGWYFFPYYVMDSRTFTCYISHPTEYDNRPQKILFGDVLRSPFCTVYGDKGALTIDVKPNNTSTDRTFTVRYAMSEFETLQDVSELQQQNPFETDYPKYTQLDIVIKQKH